MSWLNQPTMNLTATFYADICQVPEILGSSSKRLGTDYKVRLDLPHQKNPLYTCSLTFWTRVPVIDVDQRAIRLDFEDLHLDNITRKPIMV
jgi:hypothetical protein